MKTFISAFLAVTLFCTANASGQEVIKPSDRVVSSYVTWWSHVMPDPELLTQVNFAFGNVRSSFDGVRIKNERRLRKIIALKKQNPELKVVLSIGGWGSGNFSEMAASAEYRRSFCEDCAKVCREYGLDGIDIDWEYPGNGEDAHISWSPDDKDNFTLLMRDLREILGTGKLLTLASSCRPGYIDFHSVMKYVDYVNLMTYEMSEGPCDKFHNALYCSKNTRSMCTDRSVKEHIEAGVSPDKIVMGVPFYGKGIGRYKGRHSFKHIYPVHVRFSEKWDDDAKVPYLVNKKGEFVFGFENERSLEIKAQYIIDNGLLGIMNWEYAGDDRKLSLTRIMHSIRHLSESSSEKAQ